MSSSDPRPDAQLFLVPRSQKSPRADNVLVSSFLAGEPDAAQQIWEKYAVSVDRTLRRFLGPDHDIDDLAQEVFLRCFSRLYTLEDPHALRSFIYSIAVRVLRWEIRRRRVRRWVQPILGDTLPEPLVDSSDFEARQAVTRFYGILDRLSSLDRAAFIMRHMDGLTIEEGARSVGVSTATFKRRLVHAADRIAYFVERDPTLAHYLQTAKGKGATE